ncbi:putative glycolipid-binding domain-containing protein [soil metagenome]
MWTPVDHAVARWVPVEGTGLEHMILTHTGEGYLSRSLVITGDNAFDCEIAMDAGWRTTSFSVRALDGRSLVMHSPEPGNWCDRDGTHRPEFDGCIDIDREFSPFTNTLPVRRVAFEKGEAREFSMLYVPTDTLVPIVDGQRYTCLEPGRRFLYEATDGAFTDEIEFDDEGLVQNYPKLFRRIGAP